MQLHTISVKNLFLGGLDHTINLRLTDHITILTGLNGSGKTTVLRLINALFNLDFSTLQRLPFSRLDVQFDIGTTLSVERDIKPKQLVFSEKGKPNKWSCAASTEQDREIAGIASEILRLGPVMAIDDGRFFLPAENQTLDRDDLLDLFPPHRFPSKMKTSNSRAPTWLTGLLESIPVRFIDTTRTVRRESRRRRGPLPTTNSLDDAITSCNEEFTALAKGALAEYGAKGQSLERTFAQRVVSTPLHEVDASGIQKILEQINYRQKELEQLGIFDGHIESPASLAGNIDNERRSVLHLYLTDVLEKLDCLSAFAKKMSVFYTLISSRFSRRKRLALTKDGISFLLPDNQELPLAALSSGEKHEFIMAFELVFRTQKGSLILIDEPELSLHVDWKRRYLDDLRMMIDLNECDAIIATHSPSIIGARRDLVEKLRQDDVVATGE